MAFVEGLLAGYGIAIPVGAIAILIIDVALRTGFKAGFWAGAGAASADLFYAILAALAGQALTPWLSASANVMRVVSGVVLLCLGVYGLWRIRKTPAKAEPAAAAPRGYWAVYTQFLGLTLLNPLTVAYFASLILGGSGSGLSTFADRAAFTIGAGAASLSWQTLLAGFGAFAGRNLSPRVSILLSVTGNLIIIGLGLRILLVIII